MRLLGISTAFMILFSCEENSSSADEEKNLLTSEQTEDHVTLPFELPAAIPYEFLYDEKMSLLVSKMTDSTSSAEFMDAYRNFEEDYPAFFEVSGNLRIMYDGLKSGIRYQRELNLLEEKARVELYQLLVRVKKLPREELFLDATKRIAQAYSDAPMLYVEIRFEEILDEGIELLRP